MITADLARLNSKSRADGKKYAAMLLIRDNPSPVWEWIENRIRDDHSDLEVPIILHKIKEDKFWTSSNKVYKTLQDLGFKVEPSYSSNPANERWFLKW